MVTCTVLTFSLFHVVQASTAQERALLEAPTVQSCHRVLLWAFVERLFDAAKHPHNVGNAIKSIHTMY